VAEHGIGLAESVASFSRLLDGDVKLGGQGCEPVLAVRHELVQRRIKQPDGDREAVEDLHRRFDILLDVNGKLGEGGFSLRQGLAHDHLAQEEQRFVASFAVEHVLGPEQPDPSAPNWTARRVSFGVSAFVLILSLRSLSQSTMRSL